MSTSNQGRGDAAWGSLSSDGPGEHVLSNGDCRMHIYFSGHVQGVGFRYTVASISRGRAVTGWVRNLSDGRVEAVVESRQVELEGFLGEIRESMAGHIRDVKCVWEPPTGEWRTFSVTY